MFLETEWYIFIGNSALELIICSFAVSCFQFCNFRLLFSKTKSFEKFSKCSELYSFMYILCIYWLLIARLGVLKLSLCICFVFGFFGAIWLLSRVDLALFCFWQPGNPSLDLCSKNGTKIFTSKNLFAGHTKDLEIRHYIH